MLLLAPRLRPRGLDLFLLCGFLLGGAALVLDPPFALLRRDRVLKAIALDLGVGPLLAQLRLSVGLAGLRRLSAGIELGVRLRVLKPSLTRELVLAGGGADHLLHLADDLAGDTADGAFWVLILCQRKLSPRNGVDRYDLPLAETTHASAAGLQPNARSR